MSLKISNKRTNGEASDQSPPKKLKKEFAKKPVDTKPSVVLNGDGSAPGLTPAQRKRQKSKIRKLAAIAKIKEEGGTPKSLWAGKKDKNKTGIKAAVVDGESGKKPVKKDAKNQSVEEKLKAKQEKRAEKKLTNRQEKRQQVGQYKAEQVTLTAEEIRLRISEIKGREGGLTKTARRKLGVFVKKLATLEGTAIENNGAKDGEKGGNVSESVKRRLRREKKGVNGEGAEEADSEEENDPGQEKLVNIQVFEKKKKQKVAGKKNETATIVPAKKVTEAKLAVGKNKKQPQIKEEQNLNNKALKKKIVVKMEPSDDEDDDDEEDESEDEAAGTKIKEEEEEDEEEESSDDDEEEEDELNSTQQEEEDDDEDDDEEEEEEEDSDSEKVKTEAVQKTVKKVETNGKKAQQGQGPKKQLDQTQQSSDKKKRYILFVGNIPFDAKQEDLKQHFLTKVGEVSSVRIPTKPGTQIPRGFGYVEVTNDIDYEKGLSLHHTMLNGRRINVEYTLAGSKQVNKRQELVSKNQKLHALRKAGKLAGSEKHDQKRSVRRFKKKEHERQAK